MNSVEKLANDLYSQIDTLRAELSKARAALGDCAALMEYDAQTSPPTPIRASVIDNARKLSRA